MNMLDRITKLRLERGWSEYELAKRSGISQSTISTWYSRKIQPNVSSIEKICRGFGISMSFFFLGEDENDTPVLLHPYQKRLLTYAARLEPQQYASLEQFLLSLHPDVTAFDTGEED